MATATARRHPMAVDKALLVLGHLQTTPGVLGLRELSRQTGLAKSTAHRMLCALVASGAVTKVGTGYRAAGRPGVGGEITAAVSVRRTTLRSLMPYVSELRIRTGLTASLSVLHDGDIVFVHRVYAHDDVWSRYDETGHGIGHHTAAGRLLMAYDHFAARRAAELRCLGPRETTELTRDLDRVRHARLAIHHNDTGATCVAAPMLGVQGHPRFALSVRAVTERLDLDRATHHLRATAFAATNAVLGSSVEPLTSTANAS